MLGAKVISRFGIRVYGYVVQGEGLEKFGEILLGDFL
jgi:hypothetical protein